MRTTAIALGAVAVGFALGAYTTAAAAQWAEQRYIQAQKQAQITGQTPGWPW